jgi:two-component system cell cycle response regulator
MPVSMSGSIYVKNLSSDQHLTVMNPSILVIGNDEFLAAMVRWDEQILLNNLIMPHPGWELISILQKQQPKVIIIQASYFLVEGDFNEIKKQTDLSWLYWIVVEENCLKCLTTIQQNKYQIDALKMGADAYLNLSSISQSQPELVEVQQQLLQTQIQIGLSHSEAYKELVETNDFLSAIALSDALTELNNRRALEWELPRQVENSFTQKNPLSLIILDIDFFKSVNDNYGHLVGDKVLQLLANRLQNQLRIQDTIFRYGGEEFVIILKNTELKTAFKVAERLRKTIEEQSFKIERNLTLPITISMGVSSLQSEDDLGGISLLNRADQNLLKAKISGRNQVIYS